MNDAPVMRGFVGESWDSYRWILRQLLDSKIKRVRVIHIVMGTPVYEALLTSPAMKKTTEGPIFGIPFTIDDGASGAVLFYDREALSIYERARKRVSHGEALDVVRLLTNPPSFTNPGEL